jgi:hypothetical protein
MRRPETALRKRLVVAVVVAAVVAGSVIAAMASIGGAAAPKTALARAASFDDVVAQVRQSFGDQQIVSAWVEGSALSVTLNVPGTSKTLGYGVKGTFEAQVLGAAVADWMRSQGQQPITTVRYRDEGKVIPGSLTNGDPVRSDPNVSPLPTDACDTAAKATGTASLTLVSAQTLPYLNGTCVFTFRATDLTRGSQAAMGALGRIISAIGGPPNERPWLFELDDQNGVPKTGASWMIGVNGDDVGATGTTWATPGLAYPLSHG